MSSVNVMETDKENQEQQTLSRKVVVLESVAPRTPFAEVNRQRYFGADLAGIALKSGQTPSKRRSWAPDSHLQRQSYATSNPHFTPLRNKAKETSLLKQVLKKEGQLGGDEDKEISAQAMDSTKALCVSSQPSSPVMKLLESGGIEQLAPVVSHSCPEVLISDVLLPSLSEASPVNLAVGLSVSPGQLPALSPEREAPDTPDLSMGCEEGTPLAHHDLSCKTESDVDVSCGCVDTGSDSSMSESPGVSSCSLSDEGISSEVDTPERKALAVISGSQGGIAQSSDTQAAAAVKDNQNESAQAARFILDVLLNAVEEQATLKQQNLRGTESANPVPCGQMFLSEYARFVESYNQEESPAFANRTSSLTDVTPCSQESEVQTSASCSAVSDSWMVVADSLRLFLSDSDESLSSSSTIQRHLAFEDRDMNSPEANLDESFGRVRSSESRFDLREQEGDSTPEKRGTEERGDSAERDFLNLSISDQRVEFIPLPPKLRSVASSPIDLQSRSCSSVSTETMSVPVSPVVMCDRSTITDMPQSPAVQTTPRVTDTHSIALSPMPAAVCDQEVNTSLTQTADVDTMTQTVLTSEVALSPMVVARMEVDTMTTVASTTEAGMETERAEFLDHSVLATTDMDSKMTMTDHSGHRNIFTTMTPFKAMAKEGRRLTADIVRKQHPRALANQLETLTVSNSRLESQARSAQQEHRRLQGALKEAKQLAASRQAELEAVDTVKQEEGQEKQLKERCQFLEQLSEEQRSRVATLEQELSVLRQESQGQTQRQAEELRELQEKCRTLEETHAGCAQQRQREMGELKKSQEGDSYRHQFERAQQMVREREAELEEVRGLFADLQTTAGKQEKVHAAYQMIHDKIIALASQNHTLRGSIASRTWLSQEEVEGQQAEMRTLQEDNARLMEELTTVHNSMAIHTINLAELEKLYSVSSYDLLAATGRVVELNTELFASRKALQEMAVSREEVDQQAQEMEEQLAHLTDTEAVLRAALKHTQHQMTQQAVAYEKLQTLSQKMKKVYEDKLENMVLGVENLQRTLDNRETDMNNLEKDLYECRNIILEQRYKIDGLESELRDTKSMAAAKRAEEEDIEFYQKSNAFLEAERSVYVQSLRDLEDKLKATALESSRQQQAATDAELLLEELQEDKIRLITELSQMQMQYLKTSKALAQATERQERVESDVTASANDLLQHMRLMLTLLKRKTGLQEVPEAYPTEAQQPLPPPTSTRHSSKQVVKSRRHARKSFVSSILGAAEHEQGAVSSATEPDSEWESGSYLGKSMTNSVRKAIQGKQQVSSGSVVKRQVKEVSVTTLDMPQLSAYGSSDGGDAVSSSSGRRKLDFSNPQLLSVSWAESSSSPGGRSASIRPAHVSSSSLPGCSLLHPPSSEPRPSTSGGVAKVRSIPRTEYRPQPGSQEEEEGGAMMGCVSSLKEVFAAISRLFGILDRATQLSLQDLREENAMLRERTEKLEERGERNRAELSVSRQESTARDSTILKLQQQYQEMTDQMINLTDQKFHIRRLNEGMKQLESQLLHERKEKEAVSAELDGIFRRMDTSSTDGGAAEARCMRDIVALKKKNLQLLFQLEEQRNHYEDLGSKAARRMRVLDENWKKAEDELYRLDELVESIKQIAEQSSPSSDLQHVLRLIRGETKSSPM